MSKLLLDGEEQNLGKSKHLWLLDPGHGGMKDGKYTTAPAKMWTFDNGFIVYEGVTNRSITRKLIEHLKSAQIDYAVVADWEEDTSLEQRVHTADAIYAKDKRAVYLSVHSNAGGGAGWEVFTGPGQTESDKFGKVFESVYRRVGSMFKFRGLKEENFYVLRKTDCPAVLVENLFFDNRTEAMFLMSEEGQKFIADMMFQAVKECEKL
jgi:N-acetylmuramoyl-L-alanine amidase